MAQKTITLKLTPMQADRLLAMLQKHNNTGFIVRKLAKEINRLVYSR